MICKHDRLDRSCNECSLEFEIETLNAENEILKQYKKEREFQAQCWICPVCHDDHTQSRVCPAYDKLTEQNRIMKEALEDIQAFVDEQAEDEGLWSVPAEGTQSIGEAIMQQGLRALHAKIESWTLAKCKELENG